MQHERHPAARRAQGTLNRIQQVPSDVVGCRGRVPTGAGNGAMRFQCRDPRLVGVRCRIMITSRLANFASVLGMGPRVPDVPRLAPGRRVYAIGDVHGHLPQLQALHEAIAHDFSDHPVSRPLLVHMGDLIDRGPDSAGVLARLQAGSPVPGMPMVNLMGNHEWMFLSALALQDQREADNWLDNGGTETLASWGIRPTVPLARWSALVPREHVLFLRGLAPWHRRDGYVFAHAGVRPGVPLARQLWSDLLWIRGPFLDRRGPLLPDAPDLVVVHGHTPQPEPTLRANRIGIDTGAGHGDDVRFLQAEVPGRHEASP